MTHCPCWSNSKLEPWPVGPSVTRFYGVVVVFFFSGQHLGCTNGVQMERKTHYDRPELKFDTVTGFLFVLFGLLVVLLNGRKKSFHTVFKIGCIKKYLFQAICKKTDRKFHQILAQTSTRVHASDELYSSWGDKECE